MTLSAIILGQILTYFVNRVQGLILSAASLLYNVLGWFLAVFVAH